jgi:AraC-like DNA-binding protein
MNSATETPTVRTRPVISSMRGSFSDFDALAVAARGWGLDWIQLDRGPLRARFQQVQTPSALLSRFQFNRKFHQMGTVPPGMRTYGMIAPRSPRVEWRGSEGSPNHMVAFPNNDEFEFISHPGFNGDTLSLPEERLHRIAATLDRRHRLEGLPRSQALIECDPARIRAFRRRLTELHFLAETATERTLDDSIIADAEFQAIAALVAALSSGRGRDDRRSEPVVRTRALRLALDYIEAHSFKPPTVEQICRASGASWRTLDYAFRDRFDLTPKQYLQAVRLQRVRRDLLRKSPDSSISDIAANWGFWHMGQFAAIYRRQFGELPSETVRGS